MVEPLFEGQLDLLAGGQILNLYQGRFVAVFVGEENRRYPLAIGVLELLFHGLFQMVDLGGDPLCPQHGSDGKAEASLVPTRENDQHLGGTVTSNRQRFHLEEVGDQPAHSNRDAYSRQLLIDESGGEIVVTTTRA